MDGAAIHLASFSRDPAAATRHYLTATTPQGAVVDLGEFVLTFAPGNLAGAAGGRCGRQVVLRNVAPELNLGRTTAGKSVILTDGSTLARLGEDESAAFTRWGDGLHWDVARGTGPARAYRIRIYAGHRTLATAPSP